MYPNDREMETATQQRVIRSHKMDCGNLQNLTQINQRNYYMWGSR